LAKKTSFNACWISQQSIIEIISIKFKGLWNRKPYVTEGSHVVGRPPLVSEAWFMAEVFQGAPNEARPFLLGEEGKPCLHFQRIEEGIQCLASCAVNLCRADIGRHRDDIMY
jgi:hypothetical protein